MQIETISTPRLTLLKITPSFIHYLFESKNKTTIQDLFQVDDAGLEKYQLMHEQGMETYTFSLEFFLVQLNGQTIGECGFHTWNKKHDRAELFYGLRTDEVKRKRYISEVMPYVLEHGFIKMNLHRIEALVADWNEPSVRLLKNNHFTFEGTMREDYFWEGKHGDSDCYSLLKHEWESTYNER